MKNIYRVLICVLIAATQFGCLSESSETYYTPPSSHYYSPGGGSGTFSYDSSGPKMPSADELIKKAKEFTKEFIKSELLKKNDIMICLHDLNTKLQYCGNTIELRQQSGLFKIYNINPKQIITIQKVRFADNDEEENENAGLAINNHAELSIKGKNVEFKLEHKIHGPSALDPSQRFYPFKVFMTDGYMTVRRNPDVYKTGISSKIQITYLSTASEDPKTKTITITITPELLEKVRKNAEASAEASHVEKHIDCNNEINTLNKQLNRENSLKKIENLINSIAKISQKEDEIKLQQKKIEEEKKKFNPTLELESDLEKFNQELSEITKIKSKHDLENELEQFRNELYMNIESKVTPETTPEGKKQLLYDDYGILGIACPEKTCSEIKSTYSSVKSTYKRLSKICHPDGGGNDKISAIINNAYEEISSKLQESYLKLECKNSL